MKRTGEWKKPKLVWYSLEIGVPSVFDLVRNRKSATSGMSGMEYYCSKTNDLCLEAGSKYMMGAGMNRFKLLKDSLKVQVVISALK